MPKIEAKAIQRELEQGLLWPVYWLYGAESMKVRELLRRIRNCALGGPERGAAYFGMAEEVHDGAQADGQAIVEAALSPAFGCPVKLVVVRDAHAIKEPEALTALFGPKTHKDKIPSVVCVLISKDLDNRKKFSKSLLDGAAVVSCEDVSETEREGWVSYLAKRRGLSIPAQMLSNLCRLDPWSLDIADQELEKYDLAGSGPATGPAIENENDAYDALGSDRGSEVFINAFFSRDSAAALACVRNFCDAPDEALPLLGFLSWNVRQLALYLAGAAPAPYLAGPLNRNVRKWAKAWEKGEIAGLQEGLSEIDFKLKQTPLQPLALWSDLIIKVL